MDGPGYAHARRRRRCGERRQRNSNGRLRTEWARGREEGDAFHLKHPPALSPCANHGSLSQTYIIPGLPSFPPPLPCRPSRAPAPSQCSWNPYSPKAHPRSSLAMRSRSFSSVRACSCEHACVVSVMGSSARLWLYTLQASTRYSSRLP